MLQVGRGEPHAWTSLRAAWSRSGGETSRRVLAGLSGTSLACKSTPSSRARSSALALEEKNVFHLLPLFLAGDHSKCVDSTRALL